MAFRAMAIVVNEAW